MPLLYYASFKEFGSLVCPSHDVKLRKTQLEVRSFNPTWSRDLWGQRVIFLWKCVKLLAEQLWQIWRRYAPPFSPLSAKNLTGGLKSTPPAGARVNAENRSDTAAAPKLNALVPIRVTVARYADDTQIAITGPRCRLTEMQTSLESVLDTVCTWFLQNGMMVNAGKTELLLCGDRRQLSQISDPPTVKFMDDSLHYSKSVKNLGVIMDPGLSWGIHIKHVTDRCTGILVALQNAKHLLPADVLCYRSSLML